MLGQRHIAHQQRTGKNDSKINGHAAKGYAPVKSIDQKTGGDRAEAGSDTCSSADSPESESAVIALIQTGDQPEDRRDKETGADTDQQTAAPGEHKNVAGESYDKFADGAHRSADAESFFPADDQADHTADDHQAAGAQRINNVGQLDV